MVYLCDEKYNVESIKNSLKNQLLSTLPLSILFFNNYPIENNNICVSLLCIPFIISVSDIYFYSIHRLLHTPLLWKYHRTHHHNTSQVSKSLDADIIEHIIANLGSFIVGFLVLQYYSIIINIYIYYIWIVVSTVSTCSSHSVKRIFGDRGVHQIHHKSLKYNYGTGFYIMDRLTGTYKN